MKGIDDPASIREAVARRLQRLLNEEETLPDLIVIDGGATQLRAACEAAEALGLSELPLVGLAKRHEEVYVPGDPSPRSFDPDGPAMRLLRHIRDEAHRFGLAHHRRRRNKSALRHLVENVPDIGPARRKALLRHLDGVPLEEADLSRLRQVPGIGAELARKIVAYFESETNTG